MCRCGSWRAGAAFLGSIPSPRFLFKCPKPRAMRSMFCVVWLHITAGWAAGQGYVSYFTGNPSDAVTAPLGGVCLMGGASEDDQAMTWFLERVDGGDVLVLSSAEAEALASFSQLADIQCPTCALCTACNALWTARQRTLGQPRIRRIRCRQVSAGNQQSSMGHFKFDFTHRFPSIKSSTPALQKLDCTQNLLRAR